MIVLFVVGMLYVVFVLCVISLCLCVFCVCVYFCLFFLFFLSVCSLSCMFFFPFFCVVFLSAHWSLLALLTRRFLVCVLLAVVFGILLRCFVVVCCFIVYPYVVLRLLSLYYCVLLVCALSFSSFFNETAITDIYTVLLHDALLL